MVFQITKNSWVYSRIMRAHTTLGKANLQTKIYMTKKSAN